MREFTNETEYTIKDEENDTFYLLNIESSTEVTSKIGGSFEGYSYENITEKSTQFKFELIEVIVHVNEGGKFTELVYIEDEITSDHYLKLKKLLEVDGWNNKIVEYLEE